MELREEVVQRAFAVANPDALKLEPLISGWTFDSDYWPETTQAAVDTLTAPLMPFWTSR